MAITVNDAQTLLTWPMFLARVQNSLVTQALNVYSEASGTIGHVARATRANLVLNNPTGYLPNYAQAVVTQLNLATTNINSANNDVDTTTTTINTAISATWNALAGA